MSRSKKSIATYSDNAQKLNRKAKAKLVNGFIVDVKHAQDDFTNSVRFGVAGVNRMRSAGLKWEEASNKDQYDMFFFRSIEELAKPEERKYLTRNIVKAAIHTANGLKEPAKTATDAALFMQPILRAFQLSEPSHRGKEIAHERNAWAEFTSKATMIASMFPKLETKDGKPWPMAQWDVDYLDTFIRETKPLAEKYQEAVTLRQAKGAQ